jgi:hypothetical protein
MLLTSSIRGHLLSLKFVRKWLQESNIFKQLLVHPWTKNDQKCISKRPKTIQSTIKSACAKTTQGARAHAPFKNAGKSAHVHDARLWMQKTVHPSKWCIYDIGRPPTHFWFSFQVDLTSKSRLNPAGWLVKDLRVP